MNVSDYWNRDWKSFSESMLMFSVRARLPPTGNMKFCSLSCTLYRTLRPLLAFLSTYSTYSSLKVCT